MLSIVYLPYCSYSCVFMGPSSPGTTRLSTLLLETGRCSIESMKDLHTSSIPDKHHKRLTVLRGAGHKRNTRRSVPMKGGMLHAGSRGLTRGRPAPGLAYFHCKHRAAVSQRAHPNAVLAHDLLTTRCETESECNCRNPKSTVQAIFFPRQALIVMNP